MQNFGIQVAEGSEITNLTIPTGTSFPANDNVGEMFYRTDENKLYIRNNTGWESVAAAPESLASVNMVVFDTNGTYSKPPNLISAEITVVGGGGGGGGVDGQGSTTAAAGGGGGGGSTGISILQDSEISNDTTITIGLGGAGGSGNVGGSAGGTSLFGSTITANGGFGGTGMLALANTNVNVKIGGSGGQTITADVTIVGGAGGFGVAGGSSSAESGGGNGGSSTMGGGTFSRNGDNDGRPGVGYGSGGGGASVNNISTNFSGGAGKTGVITIKEYLSIL